MRKKNTNLQLGKPLVPSEHRFKRTVVETIALGASVPSGWTTDGANGIYRQWFYKLSDLPEYEEFTNLFAQYKITGVATRMYLVPQTAESLKTPMKEPEQQRYRHSKTHKYL